MAFTPKGTKAPARFAARKTKPRPAYEASPAPRTDAEQENLLAHPWPFPETAVRGRLVRNRFSPRLCYWLEIGRWCAVPVALTLLGAAIYVVL